MDEQFRQLVDYVKQHLGQGVPEEHIRQMLLQHNWSPELVDRAVALTKAPTAPAHPAYQAPSQPAQVLETQQQPVQNTAVQPPLDPSVPQKYRVFRAIGDTFQAIKHNAVTCLLAALISYAVAAGSMFLISLIITHVLYGSSGSAFVSNAKLLTALIGSLLLYTIWYAFVYAFALTTTSLAVYDGAERRKRSIGALLSASLNRTSLVVGVNALVTLIALWPVVIAIVLPFSLLFSGHTGGPLLILTPILMIAAVAWAYVVMMRLALAPYVALFEPHVPVMQTLKRSKYLLRKGGQWFLVKGLLVIALAVGVLAAASHQTLQQLNATTNLSLNLILIALSIFINGVLVVLYRNRKAVKG